MNPRNLIDDFAGAEKIYLNNASVSLLPTISIKAMTDFLVTYNRAGPDSMYADSYVTGNLRSTRKVISEIIGCRPEEIALTQSTTNGVNMVASGIKLPPHSNIILRGAAHEHHANYYPWLNLSKRAGIKSLEIDDNGFFDMHQLKNAIDSNTRLVALSHALYNTGAILPIQEVGEILGKENIPFFVDAAQTVGCAGSFDVGALGCNFMSFNGSKWLCGPMGTGLFYCRRDSGGLLEPTQIGYESAMIYDGNQLAFKDAPDRFQAGFRNYVGMVGLEASARYLLEHGLQNIRRRIIVLADQLRDGLAEIPGVTLYGPAEQERRTSIVSFTVAGHDPKRIVERMEMRGIVLAERESLDKKMVRASPHLFNTEDDIQAVIRAIRDL